VLALRLARSHARRQSSGMFKRLACWGRYPGIFGGLQAFEAMKLLRDLPGQLSNELLVLDLLAL